MDDDVVDYEALQHVDGVIGVRRNVQCQIIIGNEVIEVFDALKALVGEREDAPASAKAPKHWGAFILDFVISIFQPLVPAIAGGGVLKSLLLLCAVLGVMDNSRRRINCWISSVVLRSIFCRFLSRSRRR